jgi:PAS domain S-box-containing protein
MFRRSSISNKLALVLGGAALLVFVLAGAALVFFESFTLERRVRQTMEPYAQLVSVGTEAAVRFEDAERALEILNTLRANPQILEAEIVLENGALLAAYHPKSNEPFRLKPFKPEGVHLSGNTAELTQSLPEGAHLHLVMSLDELNRQTRDVVLVFAAGLLVLLVALNLGLRAALHRTIVDPVSTLAEIVEQVRLRADYQQRVPASGADELVRLSESFNAMMRVIQEREDDLRRLTLFQGTLLDSAAAGIISTDPAGTVTSFNPAAERLLGYSADEVIGKLTPAHWHDAGEMVRHALQLSKELGAEIAPGFDVFVARLRHQRTEEREWTCIRKDGTRLPVLLSATALRGESGQITGFLGLINDLTERKKAEAALREKTEELDRYFTHTLDLLCIADMEGFFRRLNPAWEPTLGYSVSELEGRRFLDFIHPDDREATLQAASRLAEHNEVLDFANRYRSKAGGYRWLEWRAIPSGERIYAVARDITERKRAEAEILQLNQQLEERVAKRTAQLELANKELEAFSYSVSHDLRAPLRSLDGFSRTLLEDYKSKLDEDGIDSLRRIRAASQRMGQLIDDMLNLARVSRSEPKRETVDLSALATTVAEALQEADPQRPIEFIIEPNVRADCDAHLLQIVLENLIGNACKFSRAQPHSRVEFGRTMWNEQTAFFVRDNGAGFDMAYANKLFNAFQRLHTAAEFSGTGIGLATVQRIIHRHGGIVGAEGEPGRGATFYFTLPNSTRQIS